MQGDTLRTVNRVGAATSVGTIAVALLAFAVQGPDSFLGVVCGTLANDSETGAVSPVAL